MQQRGEGTETKNGAWRTGCWWELTSGSRLGVEVSTGRRPQDPESFHLKAQPFPEATGRPEGSSAAVGGGGERAKDLTGDLFMEEAYITLFHVPLARFSQTDIPNSPERWEMPTFRPWRTRKLVCGAVTSLCHNWVPSRAWCHPVAPSQPPPGGTPVLRKARAHWVSVSGPYSLDHLPLNTHSLMFSAVGKRASNPVRLHMERRGTF